ncbi:MAG: AAA family ATPase, partial [Ardenticatenales bacterium]|nr:AAA family ATPase [Ardenticatenales bacterium]
MAEHALTSSPIQVTTLLVELLEHASLLPEAVRAIIERYGGTLVSPPEQARPLLTAQFGWPVPRVDDSRRAIRAALAIQAEGAALNPYRIQMPFRLALHTEELSLVPGEAPPSVTPAISTLIPLAATAPAGSIVITHDTYQQVATLFETTLLGQSDIPLYAVQSERPRASRVIRGVAGMETPMIDRETELATLQQTFQDAATSEQLRALLLIADAGVGKSRLLAEFNHWVEERPESVRFFKGRASSQIVQQPYALIRDLFAFRFDIRESDREIMARAKLEQGFRKFMGAEGTENAHFLGHLLGFDFSESPYLRGILRDTRQIRDRAFHYAKRFFEAITVGRRSAVQLMRTSGGQGDRPLVVIFLEDIHWADDGSLDLIEHLVQSCEASPILLVALSRPSLWQRRPEWGQNFPENQVLRLPLAPLPVTESQAMVRAVLRRLDKIPLPLEELIIQHSEGNPFHIEEIVKMLIEEGVIVTEREPWRVDLEQLSLIRVPTTLIGILQTRLDALPEAEYTLLQQAAVIGRVFWERALEHLSHEEQAAQTSIRQRLQQLQQREFIIERQGSAFGDTREFIFKYALFHDVTYNSVLPAQRQHYHAKVAKWLIEQGGERLDSWAGLIGEHFEQAGETALAATWYGQAGKYAQESYAPDAAIRHYQKALRFLPEGEEHTTRRLTLYEGLGDMLYRQVQYAEAAVAYRAMGEAAELAGDTLAKVRAWYSLSTIQRSLIEPEEAQRSAEQAIARAQAALELPDRAPYAERLRVELAHSLLVKGWALWSLGNAAEALRLGKEALALSSAENAQEVMANCLDFLGQIHMVGEQYSEAHSLMEQALKLFRRLDNRRMVCMMLCNMGVNDRFQGDYASSVEHIQKGLLLAQEIGERDIQLGVRQNLGSAKAGLGEYAAA